MTDRPYETADAGVLRIAYERYGRRGGPAVVLLHGFPYDPRCFDDVAGQLGVRGADVVVPYLRGFGPTRFLRADTVRSGQQAALAADLVHLITTLALDRPVVAGFDWGGRAATVTAMLRPALVSGLVSVDGYNVHALAASPEPIDPERERKLWYNYYLHGERGRLGLERHREALARLLWAEWSPTWQFTDEAFAATARSFHNPDFVDVAVHSYRHRFQLVPGDPCHDEDEARIALLPQIHVPTIAISALEDGLRPPKPTTEHLQRFPHLVDDLRLSVGHNAPQEAPDEFAAAVARLRFSEPR